MPTSEARLEASRRWREKNPERVKAAGRAGMARYRTENPPLYWFKHLRKRAEDGGRVFDLTEEFLAELLGPMVCSVTGLPLQHTSTCGPRDGQVKNPWAPSVDRIDSKGGYTKDNVRITCWAFNMAKGPWNEEVFAKMARSYVEKQSG